MSNSNDPIGVSDVRLGIPVADQRASTRAYQILLGAPVSDGEWAAANGTVLLRDADADLSIDFVVADEARARAELARRGLSPTGEVSIGVTELTRPRPDGPVLDHIVLTHRDEDAAIALYAGRFGMSLRRVRPLGDELVQLFFRTSTLVVEVVAGPAMAERELFGGIAWLTDDIDAEQERLVEAGLDTSEVRVGRKPGTRVCTVRERVLGTPTLLIEQSPRSDDPS
ncbi:VOC family protein [Gordonia liuliyuniae]|uniref:VOC family protein n=1 Tax=Gordonia liuliyuniae TaxID=2911517 RepID=A0ABS9IQC1_9ACTN|nr:VOC family protein [Gordonia liuliyuniae]MCF8587759.1 VOC family protein [Gordonia liuliyuniae]